MPGVEILSVENCARRWRTFHETYSICTLLQTCGPAEWIYRREHHCAQGGDLMLMEPGELHVTTRITPLGNFRVLLLEPALVCSAAREADAPPPHFRLANLTDPAMFGVFARLHASIESGASLLERESRLSECIQAMLEHCAESPPEPRRSSRGRPAIERARGFVEAHYAQEISLRGLAAAAGLSRYHLVRAFTAAYGMPPHAFQLHVRVQRARMLLRAGVPPAKAAADTGFADQSHLNRHFKRIWGTTPGMYASVAAT